jgi:hypothetical protein
VRLGILVALLPWAGVASAKPPEQVAIADAEGTVIDAAELLAMDPVTLEGARAVRASRAKALVLVGKETGLLPRVAQRVLEGTNCLCFMLGPDAVDSLSIPGSLGQPEKWVRLTRGHAAARTLAADSEIRGPPLDWPKRGNVIMVAGGAKSGRPVLADFPRGKGRVVVCQADPKALVKKSSGRLLLASLLHYVTTAEPWKPRRAALFGQARTPLMRWFDRVGALYSRNPEFPVLRQSKALRPNLVILCGDDGAVDMLQRLDPRWTDTIERLLFQHSRIVVVNAGDKMRRALSDITHVSVDWDDRDQRFRLEAGRPLAAGLVPRVVRRLPRKQPGIRFGERAGPQEVVSPGRLVRVPHGASELVVCQISPTEAGEPAQKAMLLQLLTNFELALKSSPPPERKRSPR